MFLVVREKISASRSKWWYSSWYQAQIYL